MIVRKLRLEKGWSQEHLAELCDLSVRTIQRIERGQTPSLESLNALASVFETDISHLKKESTMSTSSHVSTEEEQALIYVRDIKAFYAHGITYVISVALMFISNFIWSPNYLWAIWPVLGWGLGVVCHGLSVYEVFNFFGADWEKRQVEKRLKRKL